MTTPRRRAARLILASLAAIMSSVALGFTLVYRINTSEEFRRQTAVNCRQVENVKQAVTEVLIDAKLTALNRNPDPAIQKAITAYYDRQLARFKPNDCPER